MKRFVVNGQKYNTNELKQDIESDVQHILDIEYGENVIFEYHLVNENQVKMTKSLLQLVANGDYISSENKKNVPLSPGYKYDTKRNRNNHYQR